MIRQAALGDISGVVSLLRRFHRESGWDQWFAWSRASVAAFVRRLRETDVLLVAEHEGRIIGAAGAAIARHQFNTDVLIAQEMFWYVLPEHRKGSGAQLMAALERAAKNKGATLFVMACIGGKRDAALSRVYRAAGLTPSELTFIKRI